MNSSHLTRHLLRTLCKGRFTKARLVSVRPVHANASTSSASARLPQFAQPGSSSSGSQASQTQAEAEDESISREDLWDLYQSLQLPDADAEESNFGAQLDAVAAQDHQTATPEQLAGHRAVDALIKATDTVGAQIQLRDLEDQGVTPLKESYNLVISQLITSHQRSQAWDLYAHMRLLSHPQPGLHIFNTMLRACASGSSPSPERAVDLYQELQEHGLEATADTYAHLVRACARTRRKGQPSFYGSALDFARQMIEVGFEPSPECLHSLLEGAKRYGDLARARWIVAHMASSSCLDSVALAHLFQTYASYKMPSPQGFISEDHAAPDAALGSPATKDATVQEAAEVLTTSFPGPMPKSSAQVLQQITQIMAGVLESQGISSQAVLLSSVQVDPSQASMYKSIHLDTFLINSFLLALGPQTNFQSFLATSKQLLTGTSIKPNGQTYRLRLEACEKPNNAGAGLGEAKVVFNEWREWSRQQPRTADCCAQMMWTSMIRTLARAERLDEAFELVLDFYRRHPPNDLLAHAKAEVAISQGTPRPKITLSSEIYPETQSSPRIPRPPILTYAEIHILHKRLADAEDDRLQRLKGILRMYVRASADAKSIFRTKPSFKGKLALL